jgi:RND family efflux transporter MFP subunit
MTQNEPNHSPTVVQTPHPEGNASKARAWAIATILVLVVAWAVFHGIQSRVGAQTHLHQAAQASAASFVDVVYPKGGAEAGEIELPGNTQAYIDTPVYARTSGYVKHWYVNIGSHVAAGQLLAVIETPELDQQLAQAKADLENAKANLQIAEITATRLLKLVKANAVSQQETDQAVSDLQSKRAIEKSNQANIDRLEQLQKFERVTAPFAGIITARNTDIGALIQAGDNSAPKEMFHLAAIHKLRVYVPVPEIYASSVETGQRVAVTLDAFPGETFTGTLVRNADAIDPNSRTLNVEVDVDNPSRRLLPGAYAFVHLKVPASTHSVTIPTNALLFRSEGLRVGVVRNSHVELVPIAIGQDYGSSVEVLSGVTSHDAIIVNPSDSLVNGALVHLGNSAHND